MQLAWKRTFPAFCLLSAAFCLSLAGCSHPPETAAELQKALPTQYRGELHLQGETDPHRLVLEPRDLSIKDTQTLEFKQVRYQFFTGNNVAAEGDVNLRGTISTPDLMIHLDELPTEGGDMLKPGTFQGKLSKDLKEGEASWTTSFGQNVRLKMKSE